MDADGISTGEMARRIQRSGLRDLRSSKTPEASLAGALARDVIFCRVAPSTFALQAVVTHERCAFLRVYTLHPIIQYVNCIKTLKSSEQKA